MKFKKYASITLAMAIVISNLASTTPSIVQAEDNTNIQIQAELSNEFEPTGIKVLTENPITDKESVGFMPAQNEEGISDYLLFYSKYDKTTVEDMLKNYTYDEIVELDKEGIDKAKLIPTNYADGYGNSFYTGQRDVIDGRVADTTKDLHHIYVASVGTNGIMAIGEADRTTGIEDKTALNTAMQEINSATDDAAIQKALDKLNYYKWSELSGDGKIYDTCPALRSLTPDGGFKDVKKFEEAVALAISMGYTNDRIYEYDTPQNLAKGLENLNPKNFAFIKNKYKIPVATVLLNGNKEDMYGNFSSYSSVLESSINSIVLANEKNLDAPKEELLLGNIYELTGFQAPTSEAEEAIYWESSDINIAEVDYLKGKITPKAMGTAIINYIVVNKSTSEIKAYGSTSITVKDNIAPKTILSTLEEGKLQSLMITFDEELSQETRNINKTKDLIQNIKIGSKAFKNIPGKVEWYSGRLAKVTIQNDQMRIKPNDIVTITYKDSVKDIAQNIAADFNSKPVTIDKNVPIGKVHMPKKGSNKIKINFSEEMNSYTKSTQRASQLVTKLEIYNNKELVKTIHLTKEKLTWNKEKTQVEFYIDYKFNTGDYIKPIYNSNIADINNNKISNGGKSIIIGGSLKSDNMEIYGEMRNLAGGKLPKIAIVGSSKEKFADVLDVWHRDDPAGLSYMHEYSIKGFEPVFIPIAQDFCKEGDIVIVDGKEYIFNQQEVINALNECEAIFLQGGDQAKHAMSFLNDDGSDTQVMSALRQIVASGGMVSGSSAGNHIQSDIMFGGGDSHTYLKDNGLYNKTTGELKDKDWFGLDNGTITKGFGFAPDSIVTDSHFDNRGRMGRLLVALRDTGKEYGIGVDENTAIVFEGNKGRVLGTQGVFILDSSEAEFNKAKEGEFEARNVRVNYLTAGDSINLSTKEIISSKDKVIDSTKDVYNSYNIFGSKENTKVLTSLAEGIQDEAIGLTKQKEPQFLITYEKDNETLSYIKNGVYTISNAKLSVNKVK